MARPVDPAPGLSATPLGALPILDTFARPLASLRLSVTDRCNLRCAYCMPEADYVWLPREDLLTFEEIERVVDAFLHLGVRRVRITGGEPLLRRDLPRLIERLAAKPLIEDLALTTNGILLAEQARALRDAGLPRITVSLDTLDPARFAALTRRAEHARVLAGIEAARAAGFVPLKIDTVVIKGTNDDELVPLLEYARTIGAELRFIEYMDVGGATRWSMDQVLSRTEMLQRLAAHYGGVEPIAETTSAPADRYRLEDGLVFGIISSTTQPFCGSCDRSRLTADGHWYSCLYATEGVPLLSLVRARTATLDLMDHIAARWRSRTDRGAEARQGLALRGPSIPQKALQADPLLQMHTRGG